MISINILNRSFGGNTVKEYLTALVILVIGIILIYLFKKILFGRLKKWTEKTETTVDDLLIKAIDKSLLPIFYYGALYLAINTLTFSSKYQQILDIISTIFITFFVLRVIIIVSNYFLLAYLKVSKENEQRVRQLKGIRGFIGLIIWGIGIVFLLDNLGIKISAVIAGLGIGGIAVALAAQAVLGDLFSYFVIFFDRPFEIGDFIVVGDKAGSVEMIGIKTTRIRALGGEQLIFSNTDLTNSRIHNFKKMEQRRVVLKLGVVYQTTTNKVKKIPGIVKKIISEQNDTVFDRGHFASFGDSSLNFEFVYYVLSADYNKYMDIQEAINLKIFQTFSKEGIDFAYPSQTLFINK